MSRLSIRKTRLARRDTPAVRGEGNPQQRTSPRRPSSRDAAAEPQLEMPQPATPVEPVENDAAPEGVMQAPTEEAQERTAASGPGLTAEGTLEVMPEGYGFLRRAEGNYQS